MSRTHTHLPLALSLLAVAVSLAGCTGSHATTTVWPAASTERAAQGPVGPVIWPLTGLEATSGVAVGRRVVCVKVDNAAQARPQTGLDRADIVYEVLTEGVTTRFDALFHSHLPPLVGPVRSARFVDLTIVREYGALFAHSGGESNLLRALQSGGLGDMDQATAPRAYARSADRSAPSNLYVNLATLRTAAVARGLSATQTVRPLSFGEMSTASTIGVSAVTIPFAATNKVAWTYDAAAARYLRSVNGTPHTDKASRARYAAANVVVLWTVTRNRSRRDAAGNPVLDVAMTGTGRASVFRDGRRYDGSWKATVDAPPVLRTAEGQRIRLAPGVTWFEVIPNGQDILMR